jgi:hypothetical protein
MISWIAAVFDAASEAEAKTLLAGAEARLKIR